MPKRIGIERKLLPEEQRFPQTKKDGLVEFNKQRFPKAWGKVEDPWSWFRVVQENHRGYQNSKYGNCAATPIICKLEECPYLEICHLDDSERHKGSRCPIEVATIIDLHERYCAQMGIDPDNVDPKVHTVDMTLINELIELDIKLMRASNRLAIDADFVQEVAVGVDKNGNPLFKSELHQAEVHSNVLRTARHKAFDLLLGTRKARSTLGLGKDPSSKASNLLEEAQKLLKEGKVEKVGFVFGADDYNVEYPEDMVNDD